MKFILDNWVLILAALTSGSLLLWPLVAKGGVGGAGGAISTSEAVRLINREKAVLIDICEPTEFAAGHAAGARNVPLSTLDNPKGLPTNKQLPLVVVCATGSRSARAADKLRKAGWENAKSLAGGIAAWREASLPVEKSA